MPEVYVPPGVWVAPRRGKPGADEVVWQGIIKGTFALMNDGWVAAKCRVPVAAETVFLVKRNGTHVGTITFAEGEAEATATTEFPAFITLFTDQLLSLHAPATPDVDGEDFTFTFYATRVV